MTSFSSIKAECPYDRTKINFKNIHKDILVSGIIDEIQVYCPYKNNGCLQKSTLGEMKIHEESCGYKKIPKFQQKCRDENYDKDIRDHIYGGRQDKFAERLETDVTNVDLLTRLYNKNKTIVTSNFFC